MKIIRQTLLISAGILGISAVLAFFTSDFTKEFINAMFILSVITLTISGFRLMYERGAFRFMSYSFYKSAKAVGLTGTSKRSQYVDRVEEEAGVDPHELSSMRREKDLDDFILKELPKWGFTYSLFYASLLVLAISFAFSFLTSSTIS